MSLKYDADRLLLNIRKAEDDDLLDRITAYRQEMEPEALAMIEAELRRRGVSAGQIEDHRARLESTALRRPDGTAIKCSFCRRPALTISWGWHKLWKKLPVFPRRLARCDKHGEK